MKKKIIILVLMSFIPLATFSQGFMVRPMTIEISPRVGEQLRVPVEITNTREIPIILSTRLSEMTQTVDGSLDIVSNENNNIIKQDSCLTWTQTSVNELSLAPLQKEEIFVNINIPSNSSGLFLGALIIETVQTPNLSTKNISTGIRFYIPIIIEIKGKTKKSSVDLIDYKIITKTSLQTKKPSEYVNLEIANTGESLTKFDAKISIMNFINDRWKHVTDVLVTPKKIIPGVTIAVNEALARRIPSGKYRLDVILSVDEKAKPVKQKEIDFVGDPSITKLAVDAPISIEPAQVNIIGMSKARRNEYLTVNNQGDEPLLFSFFMTQPKGLMNVGMKDIVGDNYVCQNWLKVVPETIKLLPGRNQKISIQATFPDNLNNPYYYATLNINADFLDGQKSGQMETIIIVENQKSKKNLELTPFGISIKKSNNNEYVINSNYGNTGNVHLTPNVNCIVMDGAQLKKFQEFSMEINQKTILPLGTPQFTGIMNIEKMDPGLYILNAIASFGDKNVAQKIAFEIVQEENEKQINILENVK